MKSEFFNLRSESAQDYCMKNGWDWNQFTELLSKARAYVRSFPRREQREPRGYPRNRASKRGGRGGFRGNKFRNTRNARNGWQRKSYNNNNINVNSNESNDNDIDESGNDITSNQCGNDQYNYQYAEPSQQ